jgi:hypothetical protein
MEAMTVTVPEGECDGLRVTRFEVTASDPSHWREARIGRETRPGTYTKLTSRSAPNRSIFWMSDTDAEKRDHLEPLFQIGHRSGQPVRVLINGLGLGMVLAGALTFEHVEHIDVVESDERVIKLVGPHYTSDPRVQIHLADAYQQAANGWPPHTHWDVIWDDIWPSLCVDNLQDMARLRRSYAKRCDWHGCWGRELLLYHRR